MPDVVCLTPLYIGHDEEQDVTNGFRFLGELHHVVERAAVVPVINGIRHDLKSTSTNARALGDWCDPAVYKGPKKLRGALQRGTWRVRTCYPDAIVVRVDAGTPSEHPIGLIPELLETLKTQTTPTLLVADLDFRLRPELLQYDPVDRACHIHDMPNLYYATVGIPLSAAHGFQLFSPGLLPKLVKFAKPLFNQTPGGWGFDGAMVLAACANGVQVIHNPVEPVVERQNRNPIKAVTQLTQATALCAAAQKLWPQLTS